MLQYEGAECPYCHQALHDGDDITVCPICGAPYHRECAKKAGGFLPCAGEAACFCITAP